MTFREKPVIMTCILTFYTQEGPALKKLSDAVDRFCYRHPRFGVPDLMRYIVIGNVVVYLLARFSKWSAVSFLSFSLHDLLNGELWRLVTFLFVPDNANLLVLAISLYFYYFIGSTLEREWGTAKFSLYYLSGAVLTVLAAIVATLISGWNVTVSGTGYVNLSMFFAFAMLYPDAQVLLLFIIPVKMKWLAWAGAAWFAGGIVWSLIQWNPAGVLLPLIALLNFFIFFGADLLSFVDRHRRRYSPKTVQFKKAVRSQAKRAQEQGYHHKCEVCGRTDTDYPDLQFRYCSRCAGYHCFCQDHIFNHVHFTE